MAGIASPKAQGPVLHDWRPEDANFWQSGGSSVASRNLWISIPALLLAFCRLDDVFGGCHQLKDVGFHFTDDQLFWLTALPGLSGATLRIFYSYMVSGWAVAAGRRFRPLR